MTLLFKDNKAWVYEGDLSDFESLKTFVLEGDQQEVFIKDYRREILSVEDAKQRMRLSQEFK